MQTDFTRNSGVNGGAIAITAKSRVSVKGRRLCSASFDE